ncbi:hypothetical protein [Candidatus Glomeribacter gigasporarum]|uniref:hypothetical protein n=1 Tax=Candidatus Glomeribacter gigasporarum TaxID=132144 RepID=UPI000318AB3F|nr:hypothetical protein [Candidatus Glomeribacter gigasporarum]
MNQKSSNQLKSIATRTRWTLHAALWMAGASAMGLTGIVQAQESILGKGALQLCSEDESNGYSRGHSNDSTEMPCNNTQWTFSLHNAGDTRGRHGFNNATARVTGYKDGKLELKGERVHLMGPTVFNSNANFGNNRIERLAAGFEDHHAPNVGQLRIVTNALNMSINNDGTVAGPTYNIGGTTRTTIGGALGAMDSRSVKYDLNPDGTVNYSRATLNPDGGAPTTIGNVAAGQTANDAVNFDQLRRVEGLIDQTGGRTPLAVLYDNDKKDSVTLGGVTRSAAGIALKNVKDGTIAEGSKDAVNGGQMATLQKSDHEY